MLGSISKSFTAALGAFLGAAVLFAWTASPLGSQGKLLELRKDHKVLEVKHGTCLSDLKAARLERDRAIDLTWKWKDAYEAQGKKLKAETVESLNAAVARARRTADNSFEAGLMACRAKGAQDGKDVEGGRADDAGNGGAPGLRSYWSKGAYQGSGGAPN